MPGRASGQSTRRNIADGAGAEAEGGLLDIARDAFDHALQRQHHEGQVDRDDADQHGVLGIHDLEGLIDQAKPHQRGVEGALAAEGGHPAGGAHRIADEERQHDQHDHQVLEAAFHARQHIGQRETHDQAGDGADHRDAHRAYEHVEVIASVKNLT
jgi:hypothetical protein